MKSLACTQILFQKCHPIGVTSAVGCTSVCVRIANFTGRGTWISNIPSDFEIEYMTKRSRLHKLCAYVCVCCVYGI